jgi:hypothetical protein
VQKEQATALTTALKSAALADVPTILDLAGALSGMAPKPPTTFTGLISAAKQAAPKLVDRELKSRLDARRWGDARALIGEHEGRLGAGWAKSAHAAEARALEAYARAAKPPTPIEALVALVDEYAPIAADARADAAVKKAFGTVQSRVGAVVDPMIQARLTAYDYDGANALIATYTPQAGEPWKKRADAAVAKKKSVTTELVDACAKENNWTACRSALDELVRACSESQFTCNPTAKGLLRQRFVPKFSKEPATDELLIEIGRAVRGLAGLGAQDGLKQLGDQADGLVRRHVEASVRATAKDSNYAAAKALAQPYADDFGAKWIEKMNSAVDTEEARQIAIAEAEERARVAAENAKKQACYGQCMSMVIACGSGPYFRSCGIFDQCCTPAPNDCKTVCNIASDW